LKAVFLSSVFFALCVCAAGCAALRQSPAASGVQRGGMSAQGASDAVAIGGSTKADVVAALGGATVIRFDSGFEVWVYRYNSDAPADSENKARGENEFVVLFDPSGILAKKRIRVPPPGAPG
jgi:ABC-type phosphate transport system substrate-binding protein